MKRIIFCLIVVLSFHFTSHAQQKGEMHFGGNLGININSAASGGISANSFGLNIIPEFGYFVTDNLKLGVSLGYGYSSSSHALTIMPNLNYYVRLCDNIYYTPGIEFGFCYTSGTTGFGLGLQLFGIEIKPNSNWGIAINLISLNYLKLSSINNVSFDLSYNPSIGFHYYF